MILLNYANFMPTLCQELQPAKIKRKAGIMKWFSVQLACNICTKDYK